MVLRRFSSLDSSRKPVDYWLERGRLPQSIQSQILSMYTSNGPANRDDFSDSSGRNLASCYQLVLCAWETFDSASNPEYSFRLRYNARCQWLMTMTTAPAMDPFGGLLES